MMHNNKDLSVKTNMTLLKKGDYYNSVNVIDFQDPRSTKYTGRLERPLKQTKNERNYTSYNFIRDAATPAEVKFIRRTQIDRHRE